MKTISDYTIYCTEEQTRKAFELGAPLPHPRVIDTIEGKSIRIPNETGDFYLMPTTDQMIGWLEDKGFTSIEITFGEGTKWQYEIFCGYYDFGAQYNTRKEATLAAIDAALKYLTSEKIRQ